MSLRGSNAVTARARLRLLPVVLAVSMVVAACGGDDGGGGSGQSSDTTAAAAQVNPNAELKVGFTDDQYILEGVDANLGAYPLNTNVAETLIYMNEKYQLEPRLAERWEFRAPNTWRFYIRKGVTFHNGAPLNAQAVKTGMFDRLALRRNGSTIRAGENSVTIVDEFTLDYTALVPNLRVPEQIVHPQNAVLAPGTDFTKSPVGTGPFKFVEYLPKERIVVQRNDAYWGTKAQVSKITFRFYPDRNARLLALQAGDIDAMFEVGRDDVQALKDKGFNVQNSTVGAYRGLFLNAYGDPPYDILKDVNVRKAIGMGIDRQKLVTGVLSGLATTDQTFVPPGALGPSASLVKGFTYDLNGAKALLDQAGWRLGSDGFRAKDGRRLKLELVSGFPNAEIMRPTPAYLQGEFKTNLGIELAIVERPDSASYADLMTQKKGDMFIEEGNQNDANVGFLPVLLLYKGPGSSGSGSYQGISWPGQKFDEILAPALTAPDLATLQQITANAMNEAVTNQGTVMPLAGVYRIYGLKKGVVGFVPHPSFLSTYWAGVGVTGK